MEPQHRQSEVQAGPYNPLVVEMRAQIHCKRNHLLGQPVGEEASSPASPIHRRLLRLHKVRRA